MMETDVDLRHIGFEGRRVGGSGRGPRCAAGPRVRSITNHQPLATSHQPLATSHAGPLPPPEPLDGLPDWVIDRAGLPPGAYRHAPLQRRLPACLRTLRVHSVAAARRLLEDRPDLLPAAVSSLLIGVTGFFRDTAVFEGLRDKVLPSLAGRPGPLRVWSAACSTGAELYSVAILLAEAGLLDRSFLLGTDCRGDAIDRARLGLYDATTLTLVRRATRDKYFEPAGQRWRPVAALRRQVRWKVADLARSIEAGPWALILWRNLAIYLTPDLVAAIWRRLAEALAPGGFLVVGKAERPPASLGLSALRRGIYQRTVAATDRLVRTSCPRFRDHCPDAVVTSMEEPA